MVETRLLQPPALRPGSRIAVIAPASWFDAGNLQRGMARLTELGYVPVLAPNTMARDAQYFAGTIEQRVADLHWAFSSREIDAVICSRGGYGSVGLLESLDVELIGDNPKPFIGLSDITTLLTRIQDATGLVVFHGPMAAGDFAREEGVDTGAWRDALETGRHWSFGTEHGLRVLRGGEAEGRLYGGCLSMLVASLGTPYAIQTEGTVLFLEDVGTKPYQIDRMLEQMRLAGKLDGVRGIVFGEMMDCVQPGTPDSAGKAMLDAVVRRVLEWFDGPIAIGLRSGHVQARNITLPLGVRARLRCGETAVLEVLEAAVVL